MAGFRAPQPGADLANVVPGPLLASNGPPGQHYARHSRVQPGLVLTILPTRWTRGAGPLYLNSDARLWCACGVKLLGVSRGGPKLSQLWRCAASKDSQWTPFIST
eukprot:1785166-Rhodomonas_salina.1